MKHRVFVGGLPWSVTSDDLRQVFSKFGTVVDTKVITDRDTGKSRGFGFVTFDSEDGVCKSIEYLDQSKWGNRIVVVNKAKERKNGHNRSSKDPRDSSTNR